MQSTRIRLGVWVLRSILPHINNQFSRKGYVCVNNIFIGSNALNIVVIIDIYFIVHLGTMERPNTLTTKMLDDIAKTWVTRFSSAYLKHLVN